MATISQMTTAERLEKLEKEMARAKLRNLISLFIMLLAAAVMVAGASMPEKIKTIESNAFVLIDENGKTHADLSVDKEGPRLCLFEANGKVRARLGAAKDGPWLRMFDENEKVRAIIGVDKDGPTLVLADKNGKARAALVLDMDGASLCIYDENGKVLWKAPP